MSRRLGHRLDARLVTSLSTSTGDTELITQGADGSSSGLLSRGSQVLVTPSRVACGVSGSLAGLGASAGTAEMSGISGSKGLVMSGYSRRQV